MVQTFHDTGVEKRVAVADTSQRPAVLDVRWVMRELLEEERVRQEDFNVIATTPRTREEQSWHVLEVVAKYRLPDQREGGVLDMDTLSRWLAAKAELPYYTIDPLKVVVDQVTGIMSYAFSERHGILALEVHRDEVVIAAEQPFATGWRSDLQQVLGDRRIRLVFACPDQLRRYRLEFYNLSCHGRRYNRIGITRPFNKGSPLLRDP